MFSTTWLEWIKASLKRNSWSRQRVDRRSRNPVASISAEQLELRQLMTSLAGSDSVEQQLYISTETVGRLTNPDGSVTQFDDSDILKLVQQADGRWDARLYFDGSDVGLTNDAEDIDAIALLPDGSWLVSTVGNVSVPGVASAGREDLLRFVPQSLGENTAGTWSLYLDGSDVGLTTSSENIDSVDLLPDGSLLISTTGNVSVPGVTSGVSQDVLRFQSLTLGNTTSGTWSMYFDGSDVGLTTSNENIDNLSGDGQSLMTTGAFAVPNLSGTGSDISYFATSETGNNTAGSFERDFLGSSWNRSNLNVDALEIIDVEVAPPPLPQDDWANEFGPQAGTISIGSNGTAVTTGTIERTSDVDTFQFNITTSGQLNLAAIANTPGFNTLVKLFDSTGRRLTSAGYEVANQSLSQSVAPGLYFIQVSGFTTSDFGQYSLNLNVVSDDHVNQIGPQASNVVLNADGIGRAIGSIEQAGDIDVFQVTAATAGQLSITVSGNQIGRDTGITILNAEGQQQPTATVFSTDNNSTTTTSLSLTAGTYFVSIRRLGSATGTYTLEARWIRPTPQPAVDDHVNFTGSQATRITLGSDGSGHASGNIERVGDVDVFQVTVGASRKLKVDVSAMQSTLDTNLEIRDAHGNLLANNDDSLVEGSKNSAVSLVVEPGTYFIVVNAANNVGQGQYSVSTHATELQINPDGDGTSTGSNGVVLSEFQITLEFADSGFNELQRQLLQIAAYRWSRSIIGDLPDVVLSNGVRIDDLRITVHTGSFDGRGNKLAEARPLSLRQGSLLPYDGEMIFDSADLSAKTFFATALHEMGHVLGIGSLWDQFGLTRPVGDGLGYVGLNAVQWMRRADVSSTRSLNFVPIQNIGGSGTRDVHWSEEIFHYELMSPYIEPFYNYLSPMTLGSLADLGYRVNYNAAEPMFAEFDSTISGFEFKADNTRTINFYDGAGIRNLPTPPNPPPFGTIRSEIVVLPATRDELLLGSGLPSSNLLPIATADDRTYAGRSMQLNGLNSVMSDVGSLLDTL